MCVSVVNNDKDITTLRDKSRIIILGNFKDRIYQKSQRYSLYLNTIIYVSYQKNQSTTKGSSSKGTAIMRFTMYNYYMMNSP